MKQIPSLRAKAQKLVLLSPLLLRLLGPPSSRSSTPTPSTQRAGIVPLVFIPISPPSSTDVSAPPNVFGLAKSESYGSFRPVATGHGARWCGRLMSSIMHHSWQQVFAASSQALHRLFGGLKFTSAGREGLLMGILLLLELSRIPRAWQWRLVVRVRARSRGVSIASKDMRGPRSGRGAAVRQNFGAEYIANRWEAVRCLVGWNMLDV